jgi:hypothetical protein
MRLILSRCRSGEGGGGACCCVCLLAAACARVLLLLLLLCLCAYCLLPVVAVLLSTMCMRVGVRRVAYVVRQNYLGTSCVRVCVCVCRSSRALPSDALLARRPAISRAARGHVLDLERRVGRERKSVAVVGYQRAETDPKALRQVPRLLVSLLQALAVEL